MRTTKHWAMAAMAAAALALAGCGGGGSSSSGGMQAPTPERVSLASVTMDGEGYMAPAATGDDPITIEAGASRTSGSVTFMCAAGGEDCTVTVADNGTVTSTGGMVTAMNSSTYQTALNTAAAAMVAATNKAAGTKEMAIANEAGQTTDAGPGGSFLADGSTARTDFHSIAISRDRDGTEVSITVPGAAMDDPKFMQAEDLGGGSTMHIRTMDADDDGNVVQEVMIVSTDIEAPEATAFAMVAGQELNARDLNEAVDADDDGTATNDYTALTVTAGDADVNLPLIMSMLFTAAVGESVTHTFDMDDSATDDVDEAAEVAGSYNGSMGTYRCNGSADCTVTVDGDGMVTAISDGWVFTPDDGATSDVADADYMHYGFWLQKTEDSDGAITYNEVETFAGSSVAAISDTSSVQGTATYEGGATGVYVHHVTNEDGTRRSATSGHFMAEASLMATFGGNRIPTADQNMLTGTIDNFMLSNREMNDWSVDLESSAASTDGTHSGTAKGGVTGQDGSFTATFHGSVAPDTTTAVVPYPGSVVGEFNSVFSNGSVAGAFGARLQP